jgi:hypothetical protein
MKKEVKMYHEADLLLGGEEIAESPVVTGIDDLHKLLIDKQVGAETSIKVLRRTELIALKITPDELRR